MEKLETLYIAGGNVLWYSHTLKIFGSSSKIKELTYGLAIPLLGILRRTGKHAHTKTSHTNIHSSATIGSSPKVGIAQVPISWRMDKQMSWYIHTMEYYLSSKRK